MLDLYETGQLAALEVDVYYRTEWDEFWSFVGSKANKRWTWCIVEHNSGLVIAWQNGDRSAATLQKLLDLVEHLPIRVCYTDNWAAYSKLLPQKYSHIIGKDNTWKIERKNLNFRTHLKRLNRKTICFSKDENIHDNVIGMYVEKYYYKTGTFGNHFKNKKRA